MILSRVSLAIMDAAAIDNDFASPRTTGVPTKSRGNLFPSIKQWSGICGSLSTARFIAVIDAQRMFSSSISAGLHSATAQIVFFVIQSYAAARWGGVICLESRIITGISMSWCGNITAAATTGPHRGPRPASSTPAINFASHAISNEKSGVCFVMFATVAELKSKTKYFVVDEKMFLGYCFGYE